MKLSDNARFSHPVLSPFTDDYSKGSFDFEIQDAAESAKTGKLTIHGTLDVSEPNIGRFLEEGQAESGVYITCLSTYYSRFHRTDQGAWTINLPSGTVRNKVQIRPVIFSVSDSISVTDESLHEEYRGLTFPLNPGDLIGFAEEQLFEAGLEKLAPMESIFRLVRNESIEEGQFEIDTDQQHIAIHVSPKLHADLQEMRNRPRGRDILLSSLYLPCVMEVLSVASEGDSADKRWYQVLEARCSAEDIEIDGMDLLKKAQTLLKNPLRHIHRTFTDIDK